METFAQLMERCPSETFAKGQTLILKDATPKSVYVIRSGIVRAYTINREGAERLVAIHTKDEAIPVGFAFGLTAASPYFYEAYTKCRIHLLPRAAFVQYLRSDSEALYQWRVQSEAQLMATFSRVDALEQPHAGDKIAFMIFYMATQLGVRLRPYKTRFQLSVTQQEIADSLGLTRETAGVELKKLELKHLISHSRKNYVLYMERLRRYLDKRL